MTPSFFRIPLLHLVLLMIWIGSAGLATDLEVHASGTCRIDNGFLQLTKVFVTNTSGAGGGPFDSSDTILELDTMTGSEDFGIEFGLARIIHQIGSQDLNLVNPSNKQVDPQAGDCHWVDGKLICNIGMLAKGQNQIVRYYFVPNFDGPLDFDIRVRGPLADPNPDNNRDTISMRAVANPKRLVFPWVSNRDHQFESILVVNNFASEPADITLTARRGDGSSETVIRQVPPQGALHEKASSLFPDLGSGNGYTVTLESPLHRLSGHWVTNNLITGTGRSPSQGVAVNNPAYPMPFGERFGTRILFGFLPITGSATSAPVVVNLSDEPADVVLKFYNQSGELVLEDDQTLRNLEPLRPFAAVANTLVPSGSGDLYLIATSTQRLTGVAFVFNDLGEPAIGNVVGLAQAQRETP